MLKIKEGAERTLLWWFPFGSFELQVYSGPKPEKKLKP